MAARTEHAGDELVPASGAGRSFSLGREAGLADCDPSGRVRLDAIARWLQDAALADVIDSGLAGDGAWVTRRVRIRVDAFPGFGDAVELSTFCSATARLAAERRTIVRGERARIDAVALWVHLDARTRLPARLGADFDAAYGRSAAGRRARSGLRHPQPRGDEPRAPWRFRAADLDLAGHVNNAVYWQIPEERFAVAEPLPSSLDAEIEYRRGAEAGEAWLLSAAPMTWVIDGDGDVCASIRRLDG